MVAAALTAMGTIPALAQTPSSGQHKVAVSTSLAIVGELSSVAAVSPNDAWAVGFSGDPETGGPDAKTLILHWNGERWAKFENPKPVVGGLISVSAVTADNIWAVGYTGNSVISSQRVLILHWNGKEWSRQTNVPLVHGTLFAVTTYRGTVWAVGTTDGLPALILHLVNNHWYVVPANVPSYSNLWGVIQTGPKEAWSGGSYYSGKGGSYIMRWNGSVWTRVASLLSGPGNALTGMAQGPGGAIWAIGVYTNSQDVYSATSEVWNGKAWRKIPVAAPPNSSWGDIAFVAGGTAWAIGSVGFARFATFTMRWTGKTWQRVPSPAPGYDSGLSSVAATSADDAWTVGSFYPSANTTAVPAKTLILHWNGKVWS